MFRIIILLIIIFGSGCNPSPELVNEEPSLIDPSKTLTFPAETKAATITPSPTTMLALDPTITLAPTINAPGFSSPLEGFSVDELVGMISNLYNPPAPGSDDPHQGVDFSVVDPEYGYATKGAAVQSILGGKVVVVINDRFPYGNSIVVETSFEDLPTSWQNYLQNLDRPALFGTNPVLTCPEGWDQVQNEVDSLSLYILYAHLDEKPNHTAGDQMEAGNLVGTIGDSGNALAPHIHIEMRYGISGSLAGTMAHYDVTASENEMATYCRWRVSGLYRVLNPLDLLLLDP